MTFSKEKAEGIKKQLLAQVEQLPQENKEQIKEYISGLNEQQLEEFLKQNKIQISEDGQPTQTPSESQCIFCSITQGQTPVYKLAENKKAIAILELNPLSKGHVLIVPIEHAPSEKIPKSALSLAQKIAKKIKTKLKPEDIKIETTNMMGHSIINIIPIYKDEKLEKKKIDEKDLNNLLSKLQTKKRAKREPKQKIEKKLQKISFRIP